MSNHVTAAERAHFVALARGILEHGWSQDEAALRLQVSYDITRDRAERYAGMAEMQMRGDERRSPGRPRQETTQERINVTIDPGLLERIDVDAAGLSMSRSEWLAAAAKQKLD